MSSVGPNPNPPPSTPKSFAFLNTQSSTNAARDAVCHSFHCVRTVKKVASLHKQHISDPTAPIIGVIECGVSIIVTEKHLEFALVFDSNQLLPNSNNNNSNSSSNNSSNSSKEWLGCYFCGPLKTLENCVQKKYLNLKLVAQLIVDNISNDNLPDNSILVIEDGSNNPSNTVNIHTSQLFWQVFAPSSTSPSALRMAGCIPLLHKTTTFHTLHQHPIIAIHNTTQQQQQQQQQQQNDHSFVVVSDVDRNALIPQHMQIDQMFNKFLYGVHDLINKKSAQQHTQQQQQRQPFTWQYHYSAAASDAKTLCSQYLSAPTSSGNVLVVSDSIAFQKGISHQRMQGLSIRILPSGRACFGNFLFGLQLHQQHQQPPILPATEQCQEKLEKFLADIQDFHTILSNTKGVAIYNPWLHHPHLPALSRMTATSAVMTTATPTTATTPKSATPEGVNVTALAVAVGRALAQMQLHPNQRNE